MEYIMFNLTQISVYSISLIIMLTYMILAWKYETIYEAFYIGDSAQYFLMVFVAFLPFLNTLIAIILTFFLLNKICHEFIKWPELPKHMR